VVTIGLGLVSGLPRTAFAADPMLTTPDDQPVIWSEWVDANAPVAAILWASWTPGARATLDRLGDLSSAARLRGLHLVLVSVQEPIDDARRALEGTEVEWLHDRYGGLLKRYRVVSIPALVVLEEGERVSAQIEPTVEALQHWKGE